MNYAFRQKFDLKIMKLPIEKNLSRNILIIKFNLYSLVLQLF